MSDQCKHCTIRGDIKLCKAAKCWHHENWYALEQAKTINQLREENERLKTMIEIKESGWRQTVEEIQRNADTGWGRHFETIELLKQVTKERDELKAMLLELSHWPQLCIGGDSWQGQLGETLHILATRGKESD